ncbi:MAG: hypothetical protein P8Z39_08190, partial [Gammaproteobacteria bacterium]
MERIQQALNKAEEQRRKIAEGAPVKGSGRDKAAGAEGESHTAIKYSNTRTITVSRKTMLDN